MVLPYETESHCPPFLDALTLLMSWRMIGRFRAIVRHRVGEGNEQTYELDAHPMKLSYTLVDRATGVVDSFDGASRRWISHGQKSEYDISMLNPEPLPVRLAFPLSLGVWGRSFDDYRFTGGAVNDGEVINIGLEHAKSTALRGTLVIDRARRMAVRLDTPTQLLSYESIEPIG